MPIAISMLVSETHRVLKSTVDDIRASHKPLDFEPARSGRLVGVKARTDATLTVSEAASRFGLTAHTLRWYEQVGLVDPVPRDSAGRRRYAEADLRRLEFLTRLRTTGMPVREMLRYVQLVRSGPQTTAQRRALLEAHRGRVLARIADLRRDLDVINHKIDMYED
jgi:DNA-binding transcriptional MerR regulator